MNFNCFCSKPEQRPVVLREFSDHYVKQLPGGAIIKVPKLFVNNQYVTMVKIIFEGGQILEMESTTMVKFVKYFDDWGLVNRIIVREKNIHDEESPKEL